MTNSGRKVIGIYVAHGHGIVGKKQGIDDFNQCYNHVVAPVLYSGSVPANNYMVC